jgi:hypothetical protein
MLPGVPARTALPSLPHGPAPRRSPPPSRPARTPPDSSAGPSRSLRRPRWSRSTWPQPRSSCCHSPGAGWASAPTTSTSMYTGSARGSCCTAGTYTAPADPGRGAAPVHAPAGVERWPSARAEAKVGAILRSPGGIRRHPEAGYRQVKCSPGRSGAGSGQPADLPDTEEAASSNLVPPTQAGPVPTRLGFAPITKDGAH